MMGVDFSSGRRGYRWRGLRQSGEWGRQVANSNDLAATAALQFRAGDARGALGRKTILELDLVGYSAVCRALDDFAGADVVARFDAQIQSFVDEALASIGANAEEFVKARTGDGAQLVFERAALAHEFAGALHAATQRHNARVNAPSAHRRFRVGAATDQLFETVDERGSPRLAGMAIVRAVRLETASTPGDLLIDSHTYLELPQSLRALYGPEEIIAGKRDETFIAHRHTFVTVHDGDRGRPNVRVILQLFDQLEPRDQLDRLMMLIGMPAAVRPPARLSHFERQDAIVDWAVDAAEGLVDLELALAHLLVQQAKVAPRAKTSPASHTNAGGKPQFPEANETLQKLLGLIETGVVGATSDDALVELLVKLPPGPGFDGAFVTAAMTYAMATALNEAAAMNGALNRANLLRLEANPEDYPKFSILLGFALQAAVKTEPHAFWSERTIEACARGPRMLFAVLACVPAYTFQEVMPDVRRLIERGWGLH